MSKLSKLMNRHIKFLCHLKIYTSQIAISSFSLQNTIIPYGKHITYCRQRFHNRTLTQTKGKVFQTCVATITPLHQVL